MKAPVVLIALALAAPISASAHVRVFPDPSLTQIAPCGLAKFVVRVPTEKPIATTAVALTIPRDVTAIAVQSKTGWHADLERQAGRIATIRWSGGRIAPGEFDEFALLAAAPKRAVTVDWDAAQTYEDGSVVNWTGAPGSDRPHAQTRFGAPPSGGCPSRAGAHA